jgi:glycosyltransferase involved in cell wall biosynthesis
MAPAAWRVLCERRTSSDSKTVRDTRPRILVFFVTVDLYGMERSVLSIFDQMRSDFNVCFLVSRTIARKNLPVFVELLQRSYNFTFLSDYEEWPTVQRPRSIGHLLRIAQAAFMGNLDVLRTSVGCDLLHIPSARGFVASILAAIWCRIIGKPVAHVFHEIPEKDSLYSWLVFYLSTDLVFTTMTAKSMTLEAQPRLLRKRLYYAPNPVDEYRNISRDDLRICQEFDSTTNIVYLGQISSVKGIDLLLKAMSIIFEDYDRVKLHVVGGPVAAWQGFVRQHVSSGDVRRIRYWGYRDQAAALLRRGQIHVFPTPPSRCHESFGRVAVEAMQAGVPTVCFRSGALPEIVQDGRTGLVCADESPETLAAAIARLIDDEVFRLNCGQAARERYESHYSIAAAREAWLRVFSSILETSRSNR